MPKSNVPAYNLRPRTRASSRNTSTNQSRTVLPPLVITERRTSSNTARATSIKKSSKVDSRKGKGKAVAFESEGESTEEDEQLRRATHESARKAVERRTNKHTRQGKTSAKKKRAKPFGIYAKNAEARRKVEDLLELGYSEEEAYISVEVDVCQEKEAEIREKTRAANPAAMNAIRLNDFEGTAYPHSETMELLGIQEDFEILAWNCGLLHCLTTVHETWVRESTQFLATITLHSYDRRITGLQTRDGGGYILFQVDGESYKCTMREIQELFGFKEGETVRPDIGREELNAVWNLLTSEPVFIARLAKGNSIRNPGISYFRRAVAHVLFARDTTGPINKKEMQNLVMALKEVLRHVNGRPIMGDRGNSGMAYVLAEHLTGYRKPAKCQMHLKNRRCLSIGGVASAIMEHCGITRA